MVEILAMQLTLYEQDFNLWLEKTTALLRQGRCLELDTEILAAELEDTGKSQKQALKSNLIILLIHLLKYQYQIEQRSSSWLSSIAEHRRRMQLAVEDSPSLKPYLEDVFSSCYSMVRVDAAFETRLSLSTFPVVMPFSVEEVVSSGWLPD